MGDWCAENLRDCAGWEAAGLSLSTTSNECAKLFDATLRQLISWINCDKIGGIEHTMHEMLKIDSTAILPRAFNLALHSLGTGDSVWANPNYRLQLQNLLKDAEEYGNDREKQHAKAVYLYGTGEMRQATKLWEEIIAEHPNDLMAVKFAHDAYFFMGDCQGKRDSIARIIDKVRKDEPCFSYLHGMYAFGLEECGEYEKAEKHALLGLSLQPQDCWSTHARAHCMEMNGRTKEGREFMESTVKDWEPCFMLATHNYWHNALFYIEDGEYEQPLTIFDEELAKRSAKSGGMLDFVDAASMLWRLELEGVNVGDRWKNLILINDHIDDHVIAFNDVHFGPALLRRGDVEEEDKLRESMRNFVSSCSGDNRRVTELVGLNLFDGMDAFGRGKYDEAARLIFPIRDLIVQIGGSNAQRDVFTQTLLHSCLNASDKEVFDKGLIVLAERDAMKKNSGISQRLAEKFRRKMME